MRPNVRRLLAAVFLAVGLNGQPRAERAELYVGSAACAECHPGVVDLQRRGAHAQALTPAASHPLIDRVSAAGEWRRDGRFRFSLVNKPEGLVSRGFDERDVIEIPVEWAFGSGQQAVTFVTRVDAEWHVEHAYSFYSRINAMGPTPGQADRRPSTLPEAAGLMYRTLDPRTGILGCFECHSTGPVRVRDGGALEPFELGARCESCHGPGARHVEAARAGRLERARKAVGNPARLSASGVNEACGGCHRPPAEPGVEIDWNYAWNVRHQPVYLNESRCFRESDGRLSCLTCHAPHEPLTRNDGHYNARCASCHEGPQARAAACRENEPSNCVDCHMPRVSPQPPLVFTNHWIGVYREGAGLKPAR